MNVRILLFVATSLAVASLLDARRLDVEVNEVIGNCLPNQRLTMSCPSGYTALADRCYRFHQTTKTWDQARVSCENEGGHLASVLNLEQYQQILAHINARYAGTYWISGAVVAGRWIWTSEGGAMKSQWWGTNPGTSANQCAYFCSNTLKYWNKSCNGRLRFICEKTAVMTSQEIPQVRVE